MTRTAHDRRGACRRRGRRHWRGLDLYHLTRLGWSDVALVEANELTSGSTWHAAGLCTQFIQSYNLMQLLRSSIELYGALEQEKGLPVDFHQCGSVRIGTTPDRLHQFEHVRGIAESVGVPFEIVSPERALELFPLARFDDVLAAASSRPTGTWTRRA